MEIKEKLKSMKKPLEFNYSVENIINKNFKRSPFKTSKGED